VNNAPNATITNQIALKSENDKNDFFFESIFFFAFVTLGCSFRLEYRIRAANAAAAMTTRANTGCCVLFDSEIVVVSAVLLDGVEEHPLLVHGSTYASKDRFWPSWTTTPEANKVV
jgi:hypothetical protein